MSDCTTNYAELHAQYNALVSKCNFWRQTLAERKIIREAWSDEKKPELEPTPVEDLLIAAECDKMDAEIITLLDLLHMHKATRDELQSVCMTVVDTQEAASTSDEHHKTVAV